MKPIHASRFLIAALAVFTLSAPAFATSAIEWVHSKTPGTYTEIVVTPGAKIPNTPATPGSPAVPGKAATKGVDHPTDVRNDGCPMVPAMNGVLHHPVGLNADCVYAWSLSEPVGSPAVAAIPAVDPTPEIDNGYEPDVETEVTKPKCTITYRKISTRYPFYSERTETVNSSC